MKRRSREEWQDLISQFKSSGQTQSQFCKENDLCARYFSQKKKQLSGEEANGSFIKLNRDSLLLTNASRIVIYANGIRVELPCSTSPMYLANVIESFT